VLRSVLDDLAGRPRRSLADIYAHHLESPGMKAYTVSEARLLFAGFSRVRIVPLLSYGDLLLGEVGRHHRGPYLTVAKLLWPRPLVRRLFPHRGLYLLIEAATWGP